MGVIAKIFIVMVVIAVGILLGGYGVIQKLRGQGEVGRWSAECPLLVT